jgi:DNA-3-methyladenine glycosylase
MDHRFLHSVLGYRPAQISFQSDGTVPRSFFTRDVLEVTPDLIGAFICRKFSDGSIFRFQITEAETSRGSEDLACHAAKGRTARTEAMFSEGRHV